MSNDLISVPRELLERLISATINGRGPGSPTERDAKALLAQRCTCPSGDGSLRWPCPVCPPEPVAWSLRKDFLVELDGRLTPEQKSSGRWTPLYSHPPTHAPVVLPEKMRTNVLSLNASLVADGWDACLAEFKRLNPGITEAAPLRKS